jgi:phosphatidylserine/phosphatidylglycerophosphate/cardiolipin synthase-like enzyme
VGGGDLIESIDQALGDQLERLVLGHHRRRLRRHGQIGALDAPAGGWAAGDPPPRQGNKVEVFVDGSEALPAIARSIEEARTHVWLAGWHFTPELRIGDASLRELLAEAAERVEVRVLAWAGAPLPLFHPDRKEVREMRERLVHGTRIACALDDLERLMHCHHEKLVIVDDRVAFVGGIDLTTLGGDRLDSSSHPPRGQVGWHDAAARVEGPGVTDVADHFALRWLEVTGERLQVEPSKAAEGVELQVVRTVPNNVYDRLPRGDFRILESYLRAVRNEHSFFNDTEMNLVAHDTGLAQAVRLRLWSEHLGCEPAELEGDPAQIIDERWRPLAEEQLARRARGEATTHRLLLLPHVSRRAKGVLGPLNGFLVDG